MFVRGGRDKGRVNLHADEPRFGGRGRRGAVVVAVVAGSCQFRPLPSLPLSPLSPSRERREGGGGRFSYAHLCRGGRTPEKGEFESDLCGQWACEEFKGFKGISLREFVHLVVCTMS